MSPCQLLRVLRNPQEASLPAPPPALGAAGTLWAQSDRSGKQPSHLPWVHIFWGQHSGYGKALSQHPDLTNGEPLGPGNSHGAKTLAGFPTLNSLLPLIQGDPPPHTHTAGLLRGKLQNREKQLVTGKVKGTKVKRLRLLVAGLGGHGQAFSSEETRKRVWRQGK